MEEVYRKNLPRFYKILMEDGELPIRVNRKAIIRRKKQFLKEKGFQHYEIEKRFAGEMGLYGYTFVKYEDVTTENFPKMNEALEEFENQVFVDREKKMAEDKGNREAQANIEKKTRLKKKYGNDWQRHWWSGLSDPEAEKRS